MWMQYCGFKEYLADLLAAALYFVGGIRGTFSIGLGTGGPVAYWPSYLICMIFVFITAAVLAEICSALPAAGSIYLYVTHPAAMRMNLTFPQLGCRGWRSTFWPSVRLHRRLVVLHCLDDLCCIQLSICRQLLAFRDNCLQPQLLYRHQRYQVSCSTVDRG